MNISNENREAIYKRELIQSIPVVSGMEIDISELNKYSVTLKAPLDTNINYEGTAFGGSLNTLCVLASYLLTHHILKDNVLDFSSLVIQNSTIEYLRPVDSDFYAKASLDKEACLKFLNTFKRRSKARLQINAQVFCANDIKARVIFEGRFVASI